MDPIGFVNVARIADDADDVGRHHYVLSVQYFFSVVNLSSQKITIKFHSFDINYIKNYYLNEQYSFGRSTFKSTGV